MYKNGEDEDRGRVGMKLLERCRKNEGVTGTKLKSLEKIKKNGTNLCISED